MLVARRSREEQQLTCNSVERCAIVDKAQSLPSTTAFLQDISTE
jgi:hypothetical protein